MEMAHIRKRNGKWIAEIRKMNFINSKVTSTNSEGVEIDVMGSANLTV